MELSALFSPGGEDCSALLVLAVALDDDMPPQHLVFLGQGQVVHETDPAEVHPKHRFKLYQQDKHSAWSRGCYLNMIKTH